MATRQCPGFPASGADSVTQARWANSDWTLSSTPKTTNEKPDRSLRGRCSTPNSNRRLSHPFGAVRSATAQRSWSIPAKGSPSWAVSVRTYQHRVGGTRQQHEAPLAVRVSHMTLQSRLVTAWATFWIQLTASVFRLFSPQRPGGATKLEVDSRCRESGSGSMGSARIVLCPRGSVLRALIRSKGLCPYISRCA
jgi:hypothetical protein